MTNLGKIDVLPSAELWENQKFDINFLINYRFKFINVIILRLIKL